MSLAIRDQFPLRLIIGSEDVTYLLDNGATFSNVDPGGYEAAGLSVPKDMPDTLRGQYVRIDSGLSVAWEGRVSQVQRSLGNRTQINCEGYGAKLKDHVGSMIFIDRDLTRWQSPPLGRQVAMAQANTQLQTTQVAADPANQSPAVVQTVQDSWVNPNLPQCEAWYDAGPENLISTVYYDLVCASTVGGVANWFETVSIASDPLLAITANAGNLNSASEHTGYFTPPNPGRYGVLQHYFNSRAGGGAQGNTYPAYWHNPAAYGNHGIPLSGSTDPKSIYPSDAVRWVVGQIDGIQAGVIQTDGSNYLLPHSAYYIPVGYDQIVGDMATAQGWHWGMWASLAPLTGNPQPRLDFRPRPLAGNFTAFCLRRDCSTLDLREDLTNQYNQAVVNYNDVAGVANAVTVTVDNPRLDRAGIPSRTVIFNGGTMTAATAQLFGIEALTLLNVQNIVAGSAEIISVISAPSGPVPAWLLQSGIDRLRIGDLPGTDAWGTTADVPISRVECSISTSGINTSVELGTGGNLVETLQSRAAAAAVLAAQGG